MKKLMKWILGVVILTMSASIYPTKNATAQYGGVSYQTFYDELSPYGNWINDPDYGYVWAPQVGNDFRPYYTNGRWAMTDYGNTWVSGYDWGWAPFHYGRWTFNRFYGWLWIPGNTWGPAWVSWRSGGGNYGWAPMGPGISINISFGNNYYTPYDWWTFVPCGNLYGGGYGSYWRGAGWNNTYINNTVIINNTYNNRYVYGPRRNEIEQVTGGRVNVYNIREGRSAGRNSIAGNNVNIYRPSVRGTQNDRNMAPRNFERVESDRSIRTASPALTGRSAMERNQRELKASPVRTTSVDRTSDRINRNNSRTQIDRNTREATRENNNTSIRNQRIQQVAPERQERVQEQQQQRIRRDEQQRQLRAQQIQMDRQQRAQQEEQQRFQRNQQMAQERQVQEQQQQMMRQQRAQQEQQQRVQQRQIREQQMQQAPQREWRRPEPQRMERSQPSPRMERSQPIQRQSSPAQRSGGFERPGRR